MNLKSFVIGSIVIHVVGGLLIYFYYHPIHLRPQLIEKEPQEEMTEELSVPVESKKKLDPTRKSKQPKRFFKQKKQKLPEGSNPQTKKTSEDFKIREGINSEGKAVSRTQKESLSEKKDLENEELEQENLKQDQPVLENLSDPEPLATENLIKEGESSRGEVDSIEGAEKGDLPQEEELEIIEEPIKPATQPAMETGLEIQNQKESEELEELEEIEETKEEPNITKKQQSLREKLKPSNSKDKIAFLQKPEKDLEPRVENLKPENIEAQNSNSQSLSDTSKKEMDFYQLAQKSNNPVLYYPEFARRAGMEGHLVVRFFVDENGFVDRMNLEKSSGHSKLDNFILRLLSSYQFETKGVWVRFDQVFKLEGQEKEFSRNSSRRD